MKYANPKVCEAFAKGEISKTQGYNLYWTKSRDFRTLYSYGSHFALCTIHNGTKFAFFNILSQHYSATTQRHAHHALNALRAQGFNVVLTTQPERFTFSIGNTFFALLSETSKNLAYTFKREILKAQRARKNTTFHVQNAERYAQQIATLADYARCLKYDTRDIVETLRNEANAQNVKCHIMRDVLEANAQNVAINNGTRLTLSVVANLAQSSEMFATIGSIYNKMHAQGGNA